MGPLTPPFILLFLPRHLLLLPPPPHGAPPYSWLIQVKLSITVLQAGSSFRPWRGGGSHRLCSMASWWRDLVVGLFATIYTLTLQAIVLSISFPVMALCPQERTRTWLFHYLNFVLPLTTNLNPFISLEVLVTNQPTAAPVQQLQSCIVAANHTSFFDFMVVAAVFPSAPFICRGDQLRLPLIGKLVVIGWLGRGGRSSSSRSKESCCGRGVSRAALLLRLY